MLDKFYEKSGDLRWTASVVVGGSLWKLSVQGLSRRLDEETLSKTFSDASALIVLPFEDERKREALVRAVRTLVPEFKRLKAVVVASEAPLEGLDELKVPVKYRRLKESWDAVLFAEEVVRSVAGVEGGRGESS